MVICHGRGVMLVYCFFRALEGHTNGDLPWAWCDECLQDDMGTIVGKIIKT